MENQKMGIMAIFDGIHVFRECHLTWDWYIVAFLTIPAILLL